MNAGCIALLNDLLRFRTFSSLTTLQSILYSDAPNKSPTTCSRPSAFAACGTYQHLIALLQIAGRLNDVDCSD